MPKELKTLDDLLAALPGSWEELSLGDYMRTVDVPISENDAEGMDGVNNIVATLAALYEKPVEFFEGMRIEILTRFANRLKFMLEMPKVDKGDKKAWWKAPDEVTYSEFVAFLTLAKDPVHNMPHIIQAFSRHAKTEAEVLAMSMSEAYQYFFTLNAFARKYLRRLQRKTANKLLKQTATNLILYRPNRRLTKRK